ncbi:ATP-dependent nuclease [Elioraea thermophila]|uniref:ATP-dependent nuclease n=1 Tax=Elioraea thermophila TaxID=2185104 RepID=UPI001300A221|nr:AAA family ATPase [Elioraea thermophila]
MTDNTVPQTFAITIPLMGGPEPGKPEKPLEVPLRRGELLFVVGPNGSGKSALARWLAAAFQGRARWIKALRRNWFSSARLNIPPAAASEVENYLSQESTNRYSRVRELGSYSNEGPIQSALFRLLEADQASDRTFRDEVRNNPEAAADLCREPRPSERLNALLGSAGLRIAIRPSGWALEATRAGKTFGADEMSDGERAAVLLAAEILTAGADTLLIIDEPERHLHRAISAPLLAALFAERPDCAFIVLTHDLSLVTAHPGARVLILRDCRLSENGNDDRWDAHLLDPAGPIPDDVLEAILGARRVILFVEGNESSLDRRVAEILFPGVTVVPRGGCEHVIRAVEAVRALRARDPSAAWIEAFGLIDRDARSDEEVQQLSTRGVHALAVSAIEGVVFHPDVIAAVANGQAEHLGYDDESLGEAALARARDILRAARDRLIGARCEQRLPERLLRAINVKEAGFWSRNEIRVEGLPAALHAEEEAAFPTEIRNDDLPRLVARYPVKAATGLGKAVAEALRFRTESDFLACALQALRTDDGLRATVRRLFGDLPAAIDAALARSLTRPSAATNTQPTPPVQAA